jgi:hypothetical protein
MEVNSTNPPKNSLGGLASSFSLRRSAAKQADGFKLMVDEKGVFAIPAINLNWHP